MSVAGARTARRPAPSAAKLPVASWAAVTVAAMLPACAPLPQAAPPATAAGSIDAELFRVVMEHAAATLPLARMPIRVDPRPLPGSPLHWYMRRPVFAEDAPESVIDDRRRILAELGIAGTDIERDSSCPANPHAESYAACPAEYYYALAISLPWSGTDEHFEPCAAASRCVMRMLKLTVTPRGMAIAVWDYFLSWDASRGRWVIDDWVNLWVT